MQRGLPRSAEALLLAAFALAAIALFAGNGSAYAPLAGIGSLALVVAGASLALGLWPLVPMPRPDAVGSAFLALFTAFIVWQAASVVWSVAPDRSWEYANRGFVYVGFLVLGLVAGTAPRAVQAAAVGLTVLSAAVVAWALAGKVIPDLFPDGERISRLRDPLGYWNALALVAAIAVLLAVWVASQPRHRREARIAAAFLVFAGTVALLLTYSRGGILVGAVVVAAYAVLLRERLQAFAVLAIAVPPGIALSAWAFRQAGIATDGQPYAERLADGLKLGTLLVVGGILVGIAASVLLRYEASHAGRLWRPTRRQVAAATAAIAIAAIGAGVAATGGDPVAWVRDGVNEFTTPLTFERGIGPQRLVELSSNRRWDWWLEAWEVFERHPAVGAGAGAFTVARRPIRRNAITVSEPHSIPLQFLAETGVIGFALLLASLAAGAAVCVTAVRRLDGTDRVTATVLAFAALAYLLHAAVDYDWDFVALTAPILLVVGILLAAGRPAAPPVPRRLAAAGAVLLAAAAGFSLLSPWLAARKVEDAYAALASGDAAAAGEAADDARSLNPLSLDALRAAAAAEEARGDGQHALELYVRAVELQPENSETWYDLARFELAVGLRNAAVRHATRARELDPLGPPAELLAALGA